MHISAVQFWVFMSQFFFFSCVMWHVGYELFPFTVSCDMSGMSYFPLQCHVTCRVWVISLYSVMWHVGYELFPFTVSCDMSGMSPGQRFMTDLLVSSLMADGGLELALEAAIKKETQGIEEKKVGKVCLVMRAFVWAMLKSEKLCQITPCQLSLYLSMIFCFARWLSYNSK